MKTTQSPKTDPTMNLGEQGTGFMQTKLLFNETMPASAYSRATCVGPPAPIVIEKLLPPTAENQASVMDSSTRSSISFSALSEERLLAAVRLAKRDLRRRRHREELRNLVKSHQEDSLHNTSDDVDPPAQQKASSPINVKSKAHSSKAKGSRNGANTSVVTPQMPSAQDPGLGVLAKCQEPQLSKDIRNLQTQLGVYIQKIEQLTNTGLTMEEALEPEEMQRKKIRQQEQAARSARILYVLQQQVKEIQEDVEKLRSPRKIGDTKKSRAMDRLAAAHRGAVRAIQVFVNQFPESPDGKVPAHYKDLGQLIRQLCLCSAKVEVDQGSAVPQSALDILQKLETLDSALRKKERPPQPKQPPQTRSAHPASRKPPHQCASRAPHAAKGCGPTTTTQRSGRPRKPAGLKKNAGRRMASQNPPSHHHGRDQVLRAALQCLVQQGEPGEEAEPKGRPLNAERILMQDAGFQQPTVSSRLRVNQIPPKERSVPWIPTSPHSPPRPQRSPQRSRPEPRCLFSPHKPSLSPAKEKVTAGWGTEHSVSSDTKKQVHNEALRQAWLEKTTLQRLRELNQLSKEEEERIRRLRSEVGSPTQWAERAEQEARERIQPLLNQAQQVGESRNGIAPSLRHKLPERTNAERASESGEQLSEEQALLEQLLDDDDAAAARSDRRRSEGSARRRLQQGPTLESMLLRMDEIQRDQEDVRRRFATISYTDPRDWDKAQSAGSRPGSPQPIRLTRPVQRHTSAPDIVLEKPVDMGFTPESSLTEDCQGERHQAGSSRTTAVPPGPVERSRGTRISVPDSTLTRIQQYREHHEAYLRLVAHETVGTFNPWAIADSLAEELMAEALSQVAAEFQDVCEEYAEAVFTSEFLQPVQSPPASSLSLLGSQ